MRTTIGTAIVVLLVIATGTAHAVQLSDGAARVRLLDTAPLTLRGLDFAPGEHVRLAVSLGQRGVVRKLVATRTGSFTAEFTAMRYDRCNGSLVVNASGRTGTRVSWKLIPLECPTNLDS